MAHQGVELRMAGGAERGRLGAGHHGQRKRTGFQLISTEQLPEGRIVQRLRWKFAFGGADDREIIVQRGQQIQRTLVAGEALACRDEEADQQLCRFILARLEIPRILRVQGIILRMDEHPGNGLVDNGWRSRPEFIRSGADRNQRRPTQADGQRAAVDTKAKTAQLTHTTRSRPSFRNR